MLRGKFWGEGAKFDRLRSETYFTTLTGILDLSLEDLPFRDRGGGGGGLEMKKPKKKKKSGAQRCSRKRVGKMG